MKKLVPIFILIIVVFHTLSPLAYADGSRGELLGAQNFLESQNVLSLGGENADWFAILLCVSEQKDRLSEYAARVSERVREGVSVNDKTRTALVCRLMGIEAEFVKSAVEDKSLMRLTDIIWRLILALDTKNELAAALAAELEDLSLEGGGFAISGENPDPDMTAMAICALNLAGKDTEKHLSVLSWLQTENGGFETFGAENAESAAQALIALNFCGIDAKSDPRFLKNGISISDALAEFLTEGGGYAHIKGSSANVKATVQAALALLSYEKGAELYSYDGIAVVPSADEENESTEKEPVSYKIIVICVSAAIALIAIGVLFAARRASAKNLIRVAIAFFLIAAVTLLTNIQTKEQFYAENPDPIDENSRVVSVSVYGDGELIAPTDYALREGENALDLLLRVAKYNGLRAEAASGYVRGIGDLYEFDRGAASGWKIKINGEFPSVGADMIFPKDGDRVEWVYGNW